eukprot:jgi/Antlo1/928/2444
MRRIDFYKKCGSLLKNVVHKRATIASVCFEMKNPKPYYAILHGVVRNYIYLEKMLRGRPLNGHSIYTCMCWIYGSVQKESTKSCTILSEAEFNDVRCNMLVKKEARRMFIRVNTLKCTHNLPLSITPTAIPSVFELREKFRHKCLLYREGKYFVQNLSSCIPAFVLDPPQNSVVIDTCAAPGNKTTHLSAIMRNTGKVYAVEKDCKRFETLREVTRKSGATNVVLINSDFMELHPEDFEEVEYALVDPSCSGSGIHCMYEKNLTRLQNLQNVQVKIITRLAQFRNLKRFVYSTCSVHTEENEDVVEKVLETCKNFKLEDIGDFWSTRGDIRYHFYRSVIRAYPDTNLGTIGFFAALFVRQQ